MTSHYLFFETLKRWVWETEQWFLQPEASKRVEGLTEWIKREKESAEREAEESGRLVSFSFPELLYVTTEGSRAKVHKFTLHFT